MKHLHRPRIWFILDVRFVEKLQNRLGKKMFLTSIPLSYHVKISHGWLSSKCQRRLVMALNIPLKDYV